MPEYSNKRDKGALMMLEADRVPNLLEFEDDNDEEDEDTEEEEGGGGPVPRAEGALNMSELGSMRFLQFPNPNSKSSTKIFFNKKRKLKMFELGFGEGTKKRG